MLDRSARLVASALAAAALFAGMAPAPQAPATIRPDGSLVRKVWHLGRVTGDLDRIIAFYHDVVGLDLRGARGPIAFYSVAAINDFVDAPAHAEFRAAFLPIPGASAAVAAQDQIYLEAFEYRNIDRHQLLPSPTTPGASSLRLLVRDLAASIAALKTAGASIVTAGGEAVPIAVPPGLSGTARAIVVRDPDGYPVELVEVAPVPASAAAPGSRVLGAQMTVAVSDLDASLRFYRGLAGDDVRVGTPSEWRTDPAIDRLRRIGDVAFRSAAIDLPGSVVALELIEYRNAARQSYRPTFQDIGHAHVALIVSDIQATVDRMKAQGATPLARSGTWTQINPTTRAVYTRDPDGFFLEILERR